MINIVNNPKLAVRIVTLPEEVGLGIVICVRKVGLRAWEKIELSPEISQRVADACEEPDKWYILEETDEQ